jgi:hypothetical protein
MKQIYLNIGQDLIDKATPMNSRRCMIAQALRKQHGAWSIDVTADSIRFNLDEMRYMCSTPPDAAVNLIRFDRNRKVVKPFRILLRNLFSKPVVRHGRRKKSKHTTKAAPSTTLVPSGGITD